MVSGQVSEELAPGTARRWRRRADRTPRGSCHRPTRCALTSGRSSAFSRSGYACSASAPYGVDTAGDGVTDIVGPDAVRDTRDQQPGSAIVGLDRDVGADAQLRRVPAAIAAKSPVTGQRVGKAGGPTISTSSRRRSRCRRTRHAAPRRRATDRTAARSAARREVAVDQPDRQAGKLGRVPAARAIAPGPRLPHLRVSGPPRARRSSRQN